MPIACRSHLNDRLKYTLLWHVCPHVFCVKEDVNSELSKKPIKCFNIVVTLGNPGKNVSFLQ